MCWALSFYIGIYIYISHLILIITLRSFIDIPLKKMRLGEIKKLVHDHTVRIGLTYWPGFGSGA